MKANLSDFLKCEKVRCVDNTDMVLTEGREYRLVGVTDTSVIVNDNDGYEIWASMQRFEPVIETAISTDTQDNATITQDKPKFEVGDRVYYFGDYRVHKILALHDDGKLHETDLGNRINDGDCCHATQENYEHLSAAFENITFERPPVILQGFELAKSLIKKGHKFVLADTVIGIRVLSLLNGNTLYDVNGTRLDELDDITILDPRTGNPLTSEVLDD